MSFKEIEKQSKAELKNKLVQMGMSLDKNYHPWDYYAQLYLEKTNSKNKVTRGNTPFYKNKVLRTKREREKTKKKDKELLEDPNYEEEEYEEEDEIKDDEDEDYIYEEEEEEGDKNNEKEKTRTKRKRKIKNKNEEKYIDYRESGIKITRLIRKKKEKMLKGKKVLLENPNQNSNVKRRILNNYEEMAGRNDEYNYNNNNIENNFSSENAVRPNTNLIENNDNKNEAYYQYQNHRHFPEGKSGAINIKVEKINDFNNNYYNQEQRNQFNNTVEAITPNKISGEKKQERNVSFGAPKNDQDTHCHLLSNGPVSFGCNQNSTLSKMKDNNNDNFERNNGNTQKYNFFIKNLTKPIKNDVKESQKSKKVVLKWESPQQKEFLYSSMKKRDFGPSNENIDSNNLEQITLEYPCYGKPNAEPNDRLFAKPPNKQIVSDSIKNTIINQNDKSNMGNSNQNDYKSKLRNYNRNKGIQTSTNDYDNDYDNNIHNLNNLGKETNNMNYNENVDNYQNVNNFDNNNNNNNNNYKNININNNLNNNPDGNIQMLYYEKNKTNTNDLNNNNLQMTGNDDNKIYTNENNQIAGYDNNRIYTNDINNENNQMSGYNKIDANDAINENNQMSGFDNNIIYANDANNENNQMARCDDNKIYTNDISNGNKNIYTNEINNDYNNYTNLNNKMNENNNNVMIEDMIEYNQDNDNTNNINSNNNVFNDNSMNNNNMNMMANTKNYNYNQNYYMTDNNFKNGENQSEISTSTKNTLGIRKLTKNLKNNIMSKFRKYAYLFPIIILIAFGIAFLLNEKYEHYERRNIIIPFTIIMALLIIYLLVKYIKDLRKYKKMAREDRKKLLERLRNLNINKEELANHNLMSNNFIESRIAYHQITEDEYVNYVFPYLVRFLKKDGFYLEKINQEQTDNNLSYWKEI